MPYLIALGANTFYVSARTLDDFLKHCAPEKLALLRALYIGISPSPLQSWQADRVYQDFQAGKFGVPKTFHHHRTEIRFSLHCKKAFNGRQYACLREMSEDLSGANATWISLSTGNNIEILLGS